MRHKQPLVSVQRSANLWDIPVDYPVCLFLDCCQCQLDVNVPEHLSQKISPVTDPAALQHHNSYLPKRPFWLVVAIFNLLSSVKRQINSWSFKRFYSLQRRSTVYRDSQVSVECRQMGEGAPLLERKQMAFY